MSTDNPTSGEPSAPGARSPKAEQKTGASEAQLTPEQKRGCLATTGVTLVVFAVLAVAWFAGPGILAVAEVLTRGVLDLWLVVLVVVALLLLAARAQRRGVKRRDSSPRTAVNKGKRKRKGGEEKTGTTIAPAAGAWLGAAFLVLLLGLGYVIGVHGWVTARAYSQDVQYVDRPTDFLARAPWVVAENYASRDQGEIIGDRLTTHYVPQPGATVEQRTSRYTTLVNRRAFLGTAGMEAVHEVHTPITGSVPGDASTSCAVPESMGRKLESFWPWHSLRYSIWLKSPLAHWNTEDAYGYCDGDTPVVVAPMWAYEGWLPVTKRPAGAAMYTPEGLQLLTPEQVQASGVQGPSYPRSLAGTQRSALRGDGTLLGYWSSVTGYDTTDKDAEDANRGNTSEFTLVAPGEGGTDAIGYVTPLTPRGSSESITAVSVVPAQQSASTRAPLMVNTSTDLPATSTLATRIREASVQGDPQWTTRWAAGMSVYEILPERSGFWAASIGQGQAVSYRAAIAPDGSVSVTNVETGASSTSPASGSDTQATPGSKSLSEMSQGELLQLVLDATRELQRREAAAGEQ